MKFAIETFKAGEDLFKCLQATLGTCGLDELSFTPGRWERVADLAAKAGLSPILFKGLPVADPSLGIPRDVISRWFREYLASAASNNRLYQHLEQVLASFNREGIPVILLKGIHLMDTLYPERAMRTVGDIDILVQPDDKKKATRAMAGLGYASIDSPLIRDPFDCAYVHSTSGVMVEVHSELGTDLLQTTDMLSFWERSQPIEINGRNAKALAPDDLLVHLCLHLTRHLLSAEFFPQALRSLYDIVLLIRRQSDLTDWERVLQVLRRAHKERHFAVPIVLSERLLHFPPPSYLAELSVTLAISPGDIDILKQHVLISCERDLMDIRMPKFMRSSVMADKTSIISGSFKNVFLSRAELARRYGPSSQWYTACWKYLVHFHFLIQNNLTPRKWRLGKDTLALTTHFKKLASLRDRVGPCR